MEPDGDGDDGGFNAIVKAMNGLTSNAQDKLGIDKSGNVGENELQITYGLEAKFFVKLTTTWEVVYDFTLREIRLDLEVVMGSDGPGKLGRCVLLEFLRPLIVHTARLSVKLSAMATVKGMELIVEAEVSDGLNKMTLLSQGLME